MKPTTTHSPHYDHRREKRRSDAIVTAAQALFGGSVIYRLFAHFMKDEEFRGQIERLVPKDKLPLLAAGTVAAGAVGLIGQRRAAHNAEAELGRALYEMTEEARGLRRENGELLHLVEEDRPSTKVHAASHQRPVLHGHRHSRTD